jgi:hypothetical protein
MTVIGYAAHTPAERLLAAGAQCVFDDMAHLPALLDALGRDRAQRTA